jgi:hypothetical protein
LFYAHSSELRYILPEFLQIDFTKFGFKVQRVLREQIKILAARTQSRREKHSWFFWCLGVFVANNYFLWFLFLFVAIFSLCPFWQIFSLVSWCLRGRKL